MADWKKKKDGKAVREDHEKLKIDGVERYGINFDVACLMWYWCWYW